MQDVDETWMDKLLRQGEEKGREEGREEGLRVGVTEGKRQTLLALMERKFRSLPEKVTVRIVSIESVDELETLLDLILTASNLDEMKLDA